MGKKKPIQSKRVFKKAPQTSVKLQSPQQVEFRSQSFNNVYNHEKRNLLSWK